MVKFFWVSHKWRSKNVIVSSKQCKGYSANITNILNLKWLKEFLGRLPTLMPQWLWPDYRLNWENNKSNTYDWYKDNIVKTQYYTLFTIISVTNINFLVCFGMGTHLLVNKHYLFVTLIVCASISMTKTIYDTSFH